MGDHSAHAGLCRAIGTRGRQQGSIHSITPRSQRRTRCATCDSIRTNCSWPPYAGVWSDLFDPRIAGGDAIPLRVAVRSERRPPTEARGKFAAGVCTSETGVGVMWPSKVTRQPFPLQLSSRSLRRPVLSQCDVSVRIEAPNYRMPRRVSLAL